MSLPERKSKQLADKLNSLKDATLGDWITASSKGGPFQIHHSQMNTLRETVETLYKIIEKESKTATENNSHNIEKSLLLAFQVWEFYRSKLAQRLEMAMQPFLRVCDELAWKSYEPFRIAAGSGPETKEPPLVFLDSDWSPFVLERDAEFQDGAVPTALLETFHFDEAVKRMPFAVIGLPWCQMNHLPDALLVCHEVGHAVEQDFDLGGQLDAVIESAVPDLQRQARWKGWRKEVFADTFGCLAAGPSLVWVLADTLISSRARVMVVKEKYPSDYLRVLYNTAVLRLLPYDGDPEKNPFASEAGAIETWWKGLYPGEPTTLQAYGKDVEAIAKGFLGLSPAVFGGKALPEILTFRASQQKDAADAAKAILVLQSPGIGDIRVGFAAARNAFQNQSGKFAAPFNDKTSVSPQMYLLDHLLRVTCRNDLRGRGGNQQDQSRMESVRTNAEDLAAAFLK